MDEQIIHPGYLVSDAWTGGIRVEVSDPLNDCNLQRVHGFIDVESVCPMVIIALHHSMILQYML